MNREEALAFLRRHQPMPSEDDVTDEEISTYDDIRKYFLENPDDEAIPLLPNSFGQRGGRGVYQLIEDVLSNHDPGLVIHHLHRALASEHDGLRYWNAQIAALYPSERLIEPLAMLLNDESSDVRYAAITALEQIGTARAVNALRHARLTEGDPELQQLIDEVVASQMP